MRLANSEIAISLDNETIHLRASLRAAYRLERLYGGFQALSEALANGTLGAMVDVIRESCADPDAVDRFFKSVSKATVNDTVARLRLPFLRFVLLLAGVDEENDTEASGTPVPFEEYFTRLYSVGAGWLGWAPEVVWAATPAEIIEAQRGRIEMLKAVFGGKQEDDADETTTDIASARDRLNALGDSGVTNMRDVPL